MLYCVRWMKQLEMIKSFVGNHLQQRMFNQFFINNTAEILVISNELFYQRSPG